jgi:hypothetical protein
VLTRRCTRTVLSNAGEQPRRYTLLRLQKITARSIPNCHPVNSGDIFAGFVGIVDLRHESVADGALAVGKDEVREKFFLLQFGLRRILISVTLVGTLYEPLSQQSVCKEPRRSQSQ